MIRFCDREVGNIEYTSLSVKELQEYFLSGHEEDVLCVYDSFDTMGYIGAITYYSLQNAISVDGAICDKYVILGPEMWQEARKCFADCWGGGRSKFLLPVFDWDYRLVCFAYEDMDANREIRMLRELTEAVGVLQFSDVYPEYKCVRIYEFNELAYFFAQYLRKQNIAVQTFGIMWQSFFDGEECLVPDYECLTIYAEGVNAEKCNWQENLLRSVSVEFECIDKIYEANILKGKIKDAAGDYSWLMKKIADENEIVIVDIGIESINAYDLLVGNGIDIFCFLSENQTASEYSLFGKKILSEGEIKNIAKAPIFIECYEQNSAWGFGSVDQFDYEGYKRNQQYFLLKDYIDIRVGNLQNILKRKNVILIGNVNLCCNVEHALKEIESCNVTYWDVFGENIEKEVHIPQTDDKEMKEDDICLLVEPSYISDDRRQRYFQELKQRKISNVTEYFSNREVLFSIQSEDAEKYTLPCLTPGKILLNVSGHMCGNSLFQYILDGHPNILMIDDEVLRSNLFLICIQLAEEQAENIVETFWKIYCMLHQNGRIIQKKKLFNESLRELLNYKERFTSQELFVILHIAYEKILGVEAADMDTMMIYYEDRAEASHEKRMRYEKWLCDQKVRGFSINIIRNAYVRLGSFFKYLEKNKKFVYSSVKNMWRYMTYEKEGSAPPVYWKRLGIKFEDLKTNPREMLIRICKELEIPWSDCLLETTFRGTISGYPSGNDNVTMGFDLKPVYNLYEEYFSDFDRFRINMIFSVIQSKFGYPYVNCKNFSGRQLQEMLLIKFRFESKLSYAGDDWKMRYRREFINKIGTYLKKAYREERVCNLEEDSLWEGIIML